MRRWAGGRVAAGAVDEGAAPDRKKIFIRPERIEAILGIAIPVEESKRFLEGLGCEVRQGQDALDVVAPSWRPDLEREIDLIEEVARLHGYETIPAVRRPGYGGGRSPRQLLRGRVREVLLGAGLHEATLSSFVPAQDIAAVGYDGPVVHISNPMTAEQRQLRPSLFPGLLRAAQRNVAHGVHKVRLFEFGKIFRGWKDTSEGPEETAHVGVVLVGSMNDHWSSDDRTADAFDMKGILELVLSELGIGGWTLEAVQGMPFHPGRAAGILLDGERVGRFGEVRPSVARAFDLDAVVLGGLWIEPLFERAPRELEVAVLPTQPPALRDISMWLPVDVAAADVIATMRSAGSDLLEGVEVLDEYRPEAQERRSLAFRLTFRSPDRTLTADEVNALRAAIAQACVSAHGAEIR
jgi:phenylalanyl-tRNA synthetase beta chain